MRTAFIKRLAELATADPRIFLITGDLGFGVLEEFERRFPKQFLNAGVAEQNMSALATGLALEGMIVFTYSIGNFPTLRCLEQLRNDTFYHEANVKVVSIGGGFSYGQLGMSHHATEDLSIMRALPGTVVCVPGSGFEVEQALDALVARPGPAYLRLEREAPKFEDGPDVPYDFGKARILIDGHDITLIAVGGVVAEAIAAAKELNRIGIWPRVVSLHTLKPFDSEAVCRAARETGGIITIEENTVLGGLGGAVAEVCLEGNCGLKRFRRLGINDVYLSAVGDQQYLRAQTGIDCRSIVEAVRSLLKTSHILL
jgi:transketolase